MGIFSKKDDKAVAKKSVKAEAPKTEAKKDSVKEDAKVVSYNQVLKNPRITEKAAHISGNNVYTFDVYPKATKTDITKAIKEIYNVAPVKVNVVAIPKKKVYRKDGVGIKRGGRKAYVTLKKGDKIEFI